MGSFTARGVVRAAVCLAVLMGVTALDTGVATANQGSGKVTLCHATGSGRWVTITVASHAAVNGHGHHTGDIIPAFTVGSGNRAVVFGGMNLGPVPGTGVTGRAILAAGCAVPSGGGATGQSVATTAPLATVTAVTPSLPASSLPPATVRPSGSTVVPTVAPTLRPSGSTVAPTVAPTVRPSGSTVAPTVRPPGVTGSTGAPVVVPSTRAPVPTVAPTVAPTVRPSATSAPPLRPSASSSTTTAAPVTIAGGTPTTVGPGVAPACTTGQFEYAGNCFTLPALVLPPQPTVLEWRAAEFAPVPIVECVDRAEGRVWFGYQLEGLDPVTVPLGPDNTVSDAAARPPSLFGTGRHAFVFYVTAEGASWTLAGQTVTPNPSTPVCGTDSVVTATSVATASTEATTTTQVSSIPVSTNPPLVDTGSCVSGKALVGGVCVEVLPPVLVLVDNVLDCSGHGIARFALFNANDFVLPPEKVTTELSPERSDADHVELLAADLVTDDAGDIGAVVAVRYVNAVTWTVDVAGASASISAGTDGAPAPSSCSGVVAVGGGVNGSSGSQIPNGGASTVPLALLAGVVTAFGAVLVGVTRRRRPLGS